MMKFLLKVFSYFLGASFHILLSLLCRVIFHLLLYIEKNLLPTKQGPPYESLGLILSHLPDCIDRCHFRAVCKSWLLAEKEHPLPYQQLPWLITSTENSRPFKVPCFSFTSKKIYWLNFPVEPYGERHHGTSSDGWVLMERADPLATFLFNVFSSLKIPVPNLFEIVGGDSTLQLAFERLHNLIGWQSGTHFIHKMRVRSSPMSYDCLIATLGFFGTLSLCKPMTKSWTIKKDSDTTSLEDFIFYGKMIFGIDQEEQIVAFEVGENLELEGLPHVTDVFKYSTVRNVHIDEHTLGRPSIYLAEHCGKLLMVLRYGEFDDRIKKGIYFRTTQFKVFELDQTKSPFEWVHVNSLGKFAMFLGSQGIHFIPTSIMGCLEDDCIYFSVHFDRKYRLKYADRGVYSMRDGSIKQLDNIGAYLSSASRNRLPNYPDVWLFPPKYKS
ncbi:F-box SKIP23-like protein (DUF295) [Rhynchospora pubera]|uniref:F-box SKIP23-like protein (DUF295) n=1 Tax=Rhynchospora pubera TaxID=906938 RepID=A0AAV8F1U9_9POAL|nr:F-box SKIP23-like protein (DUF295) [Rhynchospora pubera]